MMIGSAYSDVKFALNYYDNDYSLPEFNIFINYY
jgi:hypothetical protein